MRLMLQRTSLVLFSIVALFLIWFGLTYGLAREMLSFHAAALPEEIRAAAKPLYLALMHLIGAASLAFGLTGLYVIAFPLRRGLPGAATVLAVTDGLVFIVAGLTAEQLAAATGAPTSWHLMGIGLAITVSAYLAHGLARRMSGADAP